MQVDNFQQFTQRLGEALNNLPGIRAQLLMMPMHRLRKIYDNLDLITDAKLSSVLILFYPHEGKVYIPLTKRHDYKGTHGGQISLPGGKEEENDKNRIETALREAEEEIGIVASSVKVIGALSEIYIPPSNFKVLPVLGYVNERPQFKREEFEVEQIIETPLDNLLDVQNHKTKDIPVRDMTLKAVPYFDVDNHVVWGATAMILSELVYILQELGE